MRFRPLTILLALSPLGAWSAGSEFIALAGEAPGAKSADAARRNEAERRREDSWPQWRGPRGNGFAPRGDPPIEWGPAKNLRWKTEIPGEGSSTPIVWGKRLFVLTAVKTDRVDDSIPPPEKQPDRPFGIKFPRNFYRFVVLCLDANTGQVLWERTAAREVPQEGVHHDNDYASASPVTDGESLFVSFGSRGIFCYDLDGGLRWTRDLGDMKTRKSFGEGASPAVHGDSVVIKWDHEGPSFIEVLDKQTGRTRWKKPRGGEVSSWSTPLVVDAAGRSQVIVNATSRVRSYDLESGDVIWECGGQTVNTVPSPVRRGPLVFCMSGYRGNALYAIPLDSTGDITGSEKIAWKRNRDTPYVPSPLLVGDELWFIKSNQGIVTCVDAKTGATVLPRRRVPGLHTIYASPVAADGRIYFVSRGGRTVVVRREGAELEVLATNELGEAVDASPAITGERIFLRGSRHVFCFAKESARARGRRP